jgi:uncharacterized membrane protein YcaP (DUF421 family)
MNQYFFDGWTSLLRILVITVMAYAGLIFMLRISGKRTLSKMNAFDFIVTVALGSSLATVALNKSVPLADGLLAFAMLIGLQALITWLSVRTPWVRKLVTSQPTLLLYNGEVLHAAIKRERIAIDELYAAARTKGVARLEDLAVVVLETTGDLTVIVKMEPLAGAQTLTDVSNSKA